MTEVHAPPSRGRKTIIMVEDDEEMRDLETFLLSAEGYHVVGVGAGTSAAPAVKREGADLLILDLVLPDKHGNEVLAELESKAATASVAVIVVTAYSAHLPSGPRCSRCRARRSCFASESARGAARPA